MDNSNQILLVGDLNFPGIDWKAVATKSRALEAEFHFIETIRDNFLSQLITEPTRSRGTDNPSTLDLVLTTEEDMVASTKIEAPLGKSDHSLTMIEILGTVEEQAVKREFLNYDKGDYDGLRSSMDLDWISELAPYSSVHTKWKFFCDKYKEVVEANIPKVTPRKRKTYKIPLDRSTLKKIRTKVNKKDKLWKRKCRIKTPEAEVEYNRVRNQVRSLTRKAEKIYEKNIVNKIKDNPKKLETEWRDYAIR